MQAKGSQPRSFFPDCNDLSYQFLVGVHPMCRHGVQGRRGSLYEMDKDSSRMPVVIRAMGKFCKSPGTTTSGSDHSSGRTNSAGDFTDRREYPCARPSLWGEQPVSFYCDGHEWWQEICRR